MFMDIWKSYIWTGEDIPENEAILGFGQWGIDLKAGRDSRTRNSGDELLNFWDFKSLNLWGGWIDCLTKKRTAVRSSQNKMAFLDPGSGNPIGAGVFVCVKEC